MAMIGARPVMNHDSKGREGAAVKVEGPSHINIGPDLDIARPIKVCPLQDTH